MSNFSVDVTIVPLFFWFLTNAWVEKTLPGAEVYYYWVIGKVLYYSITLLDVSWNSSKIDFGQKAKKQE